MRKFKKPLKVLKALPNLQELCIWIVHNKKWSAAGLVRFLAIGERLQKLSLKTEVDSRDHESWRSYVSNMWNIRQESGSAYYVIEKGCN